MEILLKQYELLRESREVLFSYLETLDARHYREEIESFGHGSIRNLQVHVANAYIHWLPRFALQQDAPYFDPSKINGVGQVRPLYEQVDLQVGRFLNSFAGDISTALSRKMSNRKELSLSPLALFTHVLTHEFHHKGQILSMSRHLGYTPPDTDMIRT